MELKSGSPTGSRLRKKHKRLDAICERLYNQNHAEPVADMEPRRSSRVRRAPVILDASPPPVKRRKDTTLTYARSTLSTVNEEEGQEDYGDDESDRLGELDSPGSWRLRLRSRGAREKGGQTSGRRKLFHQLGTVESELGDEKFTVVRSQRPGRVKAVNGFGTGDKEAEIQFSEGGSAKELSDGCEGKEGSGEHEMRLPRNEGHEGGMTILGLETGTGNKGEGVDGDAVELELKEVKGKETLDGLKLEEKPDGNGHVENIEQRDSRNVEGLASGVDGKNEADVIEVDGALTNQVEDGGCCPAGGSGVLEVDEMTMECVKDVKVETFKHNSTNTHRRSWIKQGRRCGLCGCGNDGRPPKRLLQDADSENEAYSGSSASEEANYDMWDGFGDEPGWLGRLLGPINDRYGIAGIWVHQHCAVWSPEVYFAGLGILKNVRAALCRGRALKCSRCGRPGATIGCRVDRCPKTYHLPCARASSCIFDHRKFLIACTYHRHLFQPHGNQYAMRVKKLKAKRMKLEMRKLSNDARRKDVEAEEKWLENCGEDDEFLKREGKRLHRDLLRIAPVYIGGSESESGKPYEGWESVAGLQDVIRCMKEVVILPLLYPEFFSNLGITPPRGVLLHGYPGTGKTLVVRALIGSCARGDKRIAYFARKGADCLGKYVGDAERQLRLLFQVAERCQPSIIFFDEIDGLAPSRTRQQDQTHSSVVSTLLALMDGLKSRGSVVVIGATNRPEAVDPALRRPGRFDREIYFPLPSVEDRASILSLHTQSWPKPVSGLLLKWIATKTVGFAGADLQALCTQAAIVALKRNFPLQEILSAAGERAPGAKRIPLPAFAVEERDWLEALACAPPPCSRREAGIAASDFVSSPLPTFLIPCLLQPLSTVLVSLHLHEDLWLPPGLLKAGTIVKSVIISSLEKKNLPIDNWWSHVDIFLKEAVAEKEIQRRLSCAGLLIGEGNCAVNDDSTGETNNNPITFEPSVVYGGGLLTNLSKNKSFASRTKSGFRVLVSGSPRSGQRHLASCILHCFFGNIEIQKLDLATISQEGHGDLVQGITQILMRCTDFRSCMIFMPRIDLWAVEACNPLSEESNLASTNHQFSNIKESYSPHSQVIEKENDSSVYQCKEAEIAEPQLASQCPSLAWSTFVEQVESICASTSLMILATSELPHHEFPLRIKQFFEDDFSNNGPGTRLEHTVPRFSLHIDGNFNHDAVISLSAEEILRDLIQSFVQFIYQRDHIHKCSAEEYLLCDSVQGSFDAEYPTKDHYFKIPPPPSNRSLKGKSSLLLALSTFGYQILLYPHFAELCWVTSKLRQGPCADVTGPWKGWPFNSCIVRPGNPLDKVAVGCSSGNIKSKERSGLVRGLIAVGLSAYRGVYRSLGEVSSEVRKVLELLVEQVNEKIEAGKDRYQYVRILSQVACLEDMVNNWAYALQSLEPDVHIKVAHPTVSTVESPNKDTLVDDQIQCEFNGDASDKNLHESEMLGGSPRGLAQENLEQSNKGENGIHFPNSEGRAAFLEDPCAKMSTIRDDIPHNNLDKHPQNSTADDQLAGNITNGQNGTTLRQCEPSNSEKPAITDGKSESLKHSNGFTFTEHGNASDYAKPECSERLDKTHSSSISTSNPENSGILCSYHCCYGCLYTLRSMIHKILNDEWLLRKSCWTVEDIHDLVASVSVNLLSAVRKVDSAENISTPSDENLMGVNAEGLADCPELHECHCRSSGNGIGMPMECSCHSAIGFVTEKANYSPNSLCGLHPNFVFRDGILVAVDSNKEVSFHCKYEALCFCSIIESVAKKMQPFN